MFKGELKFDPDELNDEYWDLVNLLTRYLGSLGIALIPVLLLNWGDPAWNVPWSTFVWLVLIIFNVSWTRIFRTKDSYVRMEGSRLTVNVIIITVLFFVCGRSEVNFWYGAALAGIGSGTSMFMATGRYYWKALAFPIVYFALYLWDLPVVDLGKLAGVIGPLVTILAVMLLFGHLSKIIAMTIAELAKEREASRLSRIEMESARTANLAKSQFLAHMNHELRTPLSAISGFTELARQPDVIAEDRERYLDILQRNIKHLNALVDDILDLSKIEASELITEHLSFDLGREAMSIFRLLKQNADEKGIDFRIQFDTPVPRTIVSDPTRLRQILINVIGNAIKFTDTGSVEIRVGLTRNFQATGDATIVFTVTDSGCGIAEDQHTKIFEPFSQADGTTSRKFGGTGLGLTLSRKLSHALGGEIRIVRSAIGQGSTFEITVDPGDIRGVEMVVPTGGDDRVEQELHPVGGLGGLRVLVVEDNADTQFLLSNVLTRAGADLKILSNGSEAVSVARGDNFDVILMDLQMPVMDGYQALRQIKQQGSRIPVIALTANATRDEKERALNCGFDDYQTKPIDSVRLVHLLKSYQSPA